MKGTYYGLMDELTYICYAHNRDNSPEISPDSWSTIFGDVTDMENRYMESKQEAT